MTVIAAYTVDEIYPCLIGDLLISGSEGGRPASIPTLGEIDGVFPAGSGFVPIGLLQKLVIIERDLVIGCSGALRYAQSAIDHFKDLRAQRETLVATCDQFFLEVLPRIYLRDQLSVVAYLVDRETERSGQHVHAYTLHAPIWPDLPKAHGSFSKIIISGSGDSFVYGHMAEMRAVSSGVDAAPLNPLAIALSVGGQILSHEAICHDGNNLSMESNLLHYFGGGFEIVCLDWENGFYKLGDYTSMFWLVQISENGYARLRGAEPGFMYAHYEGDILLLRHGKFRGLQATDQMLRAIPPLDRRVTRQELDALFQKFRRAEWGTRLNLNSQYVMHYVNVVVGTNYKGTFSAGPELGGIRFRETNWKTTLLEFDDALAEKLLRATQVFFQNLPPDPPL